MAEITGVTVTTKDLVRISYRFETADRHAVAVHQRPMMEARFEGVRAGQTGEQYQGVHNLQVGDSIPVRYLAKDPRYCRLESLAQQEATGICGHELKVKAAGFVVACVLFFLAVFSGVIGPLTNVRALMHGHGLFDIALYAVPVLLALYVLKAPGAFERFLANSFFVRLPIVTSMAWWLDLSNVTIDGDDAMSTQVMSPQTAFLNSSDNMLVTGHAVEQVTPDPSATLVMATSVPSAPTPSTTSYEIVLQELKSACLDSEKEHVAENAARATWTIPLTCEQLSELMRTSNFYPTKKSIMKKLYSKLSDAHNFDLLLQDHCRWDFEKDDMRREVGLA